MLQRLIPLPVRVALRRILRHARNLTDFRPFVHRTPVHDVFPHTVSERHSVLLKKVPEDYVQLQKNKIVTLRIACAVVNGIVIQPGQFFSFWRLVGRPTAAKGYTPGFELQGGRLIKSIAGGLCQLTNALCFCAINAGLRIIERHRHGLDLFRDDNRDVPFGSGATVLFNFKDLVLQNTLDYPVQIRARVEEKHLIVEIRTREVPQLSYQLEERAHRVYDEKGKQYRENEIWQITHHEEDIIAEQLLFKNKAELMYDWEE